MTERKSVYIRLDANHAKGMGHLYRMVTLSNILSLNTFIVNFIVRTNKIAEEILKNKKCEYLAFPESMSEEEIIEKVLSMQNFLPVLWIFDILSTETIWIKSIKEKGVKVICFDDEKAGLYEADLVINSIVHSWGGYKREDVKALLFEGISYTIVNPSVIQLRRKRIIDKNKVLSVAITMGGSDTHGSTLIILRAVLAFLKDKCKFNVYTGPHFLHQRELSSLLPTLDFDVSITHFPSDLHQELNSNDVIICGGGVTLFEACSMGFPVLSFANEFHEEKNIDYFSSLNFCRFLGSIKDVDIKGIGGRLNAFLSDIELLNEMSNSAFNTVKDGTNNCVESICNIL